MRIVKRIIVLGILKVSQRGGGKQKIYVAQKKHEWIADTPSIGCKANRNKKLRCREQ